MPATRRPRSAAYPISAKRRPAPRTSARSPSCGNRHPAGAAGSARSTTSASACATSSPRSRSCCSAASRRW
ncbi:hypothetical protein L810_3413 [Burkholderia sp. AU4i]|nr:hypothetical protein L810_3413 [Burkholderia sp. AU4i]